MRIVGGKYRGKNLFEPKSDEVRPTSDRAREAIFNILYSKIGGVEGRKVLDVFAGTGALGFEALSRGAQSVCFIDKNTQLVLRNAKLFVKEDDKIKIVCADATRSLHLKEKYNLIFCDAPYDKGLNEKALESLLSGGFIEEGALCVVETRYNEDLTLSPFFELLDERIYGMAKVRLYTFCS